MKRWAWMLAVGCMVLLAGAVLHHVGYWDQTPASHINGKQAEQRYFHCQPRHWRQLFLQR